MPWLINASQLDKFRKNQKNVIILDASWYLPDMLRNPKSDFLNHHIQGARFFDIDAFHDQASPLPNMLLRDEQIIGEKLGELGITNEHKIIFYDDSDLHTSCRALWMLKVFGHHPNQLYILDGGYQSWKKYGGKIETSEPRPVQSKQYKVDFQAHFIRTLVQMKTNLHHPTEQVLDLRHAIRYSGGPEYRPGLRSGHIPGSFCFPYTTMFDTENHFKPIDRIKKQLIGIGVELDTPIITTCGSGLTSAILNFVLDLMNIENNSIYDGSWSEWGSNTLYTGEINLSERPIETIFDL